MNIQRYHRRSVGNSVLVEAVKLTEENVGEVANWCNAQMIEEKDPVSLKMFDSLNIATPQGNERGQIGEYVVCVAGSFVRCSADDFEKLYEPIGKPHVPKTRAADPFEGLRRASE